MFDAVRYVDELFREAIASRASDIHIEPLKERIRIRLRIDGMLVETASLTKEQGMMVNARLKVMAGMDLAERRIPQDGAMTLTLEQEDYEIRLSTLPVIFGEKMVLRLLYQRSHPLNLSQLGMEEEQIGTLARLLCRPGLIIVTGPTGSGKTTTLYAVLQELNQVERNIVTLEDPVELQIPGINQVQILPKAGFTFVNGLRAILRQDPNVIMIGEIRDRETAEIAIAAALTGHLVLSTLHTTDSPGAIIRLLDMGIPAYQITGAITGVIAQRLIRLICRNCQGAGCTTCKQTGFYGRSGIFEILAVDEQVQMWIQQRCTPSELRSKLMARGMRTLWDSFRKRVAKGETTEEEWLKVMAYGEFSHQ